MELIYINIKNYRTFQEQEIHLTDKFQVSIEDNKLKIRKNEKHLKIFPDNISNINVIVGKNASGKTSLLDLIGDRITTRRHNNQVLAEEQCSSAPCTSILDIMDGNNGTNLTLQSSYFMLYTNHTTEEDHDIFLFESNDTELSTNLLQSPTLDGNADYFAHKSWVSVVCSLREQQLYVLETSQRYQWNEETDTGIIEQENVILYFHPEKANQVLLHNERSVLYDEPAISIGRRYCRSHTETLYSQLELLKQHMNTKNSELYKNSNYQVCLDFTPYVKQGLESKKSNFTWLKKIIENYSDSEQFLVLFLYAQLCYLCYYTEVDPTNSYEDYPCQNECCIISLLPQNGISPQKVSFDALKETMLDKLYTVSQEVERTHQNSHNAVSGMILDELDDYIKYVTNTLQISQDFFQTCEANTIKLVFNQLKLYITFLGETDLSFFNDFFDSVIDCKLRWEESQITMPVHKTTKKIQYLSDGEQEYLSFFTAIEQQIQSFTMEKKKYILILDEIERSMHPEMCRTFLSDFMKFLKNYPDKTFQIIISSHSPFLISDLPQSSLICLEKKDGKSIIRPALERTFAQNIHTILKSDFFLEQTSGEYANTFVKELANYLRRGSKESPEDFLKENFQISLEQGQGNEFISHVISEIGEPILRTALEKCTKNGWAHLQL